MATTAGSCAGCHWFDPSYWDSYSSARILLLFSHWFFRQFMQTKFNLMHNELQAHSGSSVPEFKYDLLFQAVLCSTGRFDSDSTLIHLRWSLIGFWLKSFDKKLARLNSGLTSVAKNMSPLSSDSSRLAKNMSRFSSDVFTQVSDSTSFDSFWLISWKVVN